jgi:hypothetical protein
MVYIIHRPSSRSCPGRGRLALGCRSGGLQAGELSSGGPVGRPSPAELDTVADIGGYTATDALTGNVSVRLSR